MSPSSDCPIPRPFAGAWPTGPCSYPHVLVCPSFLLDQACGCLCHSDTHPSQGPRGEFLSAFPILGDNQSISPVVPQLQAPGPRALPHRCQRLQLGRSADINKCHSLVAQIGKFRAREGKKFIQSHMKRVAELEPEFPPANISYLLPPTGGYNSFLRAPSRTTWALITSSPCTEVSRQQTL